MSAVTNTNEPRLGVAAAATKPMRDLQPPAAPLPGVPFTMSAWALDLLLADVLRS